MGLSKDNEKKIQIPAKNGKNCLLVGGEPIACFTSVAEDLNSGIPRTNPSDQGES